MRLLLDEDVPHALRRYFPEHDVRTVQYMGWSGKSNGELLALARDEFDAFVTLDQRIPYQRNITSADVAVIVLIPGTDSIDVSRTLVPQILECLSIVSRGEVVHIYPQRTEE